MKDTSPSTIFLRDYRPPAWLVETLDLTFELGEESTLVLARLNGRRNPEGDGGPLVLDGKSLVTESVRLDGMELREGEYTLEAERLTIDEVPDRFVLETTVRLYPHQNTSLEGLYKSSGNFCTQCEAEGFRAITWFPDRPDVMARYVTTIRADRQRYPVLLSNGNCVGSGDLPDGRHWVAWEDPFCKPSYLFALVAGDLAAWRDALTTRSGREVRLSIYVQERNLDRCEHAMRSLKQAMHWDEEVFGLECDLDDYKIVAVDDFNMGAMENKGLNIFNTACILARPETATDTDYHNIQSIIGHEYFHNWTGNRVTCRDWFQLSLKEGLTVFRDQEFSADMASRPVVRVGDVRMLRSVQFAEDSGPMAHPVRPSSYIEISNFYTATVYNKGAEVIRMIHTLLGPERFRQGMDTYIGRHDGQAVTTDEFVQAMQDASGVDLEQFRNWYSQAGTPELAVQSRYDAEKQVYTLDVKQACPPTPGQPDKAAFHIPLMLGLLGPDGSELPLQMEGEDSPPPGRSRVLDVRNAHQVFRFTGIGQEPVPSLLRNFSAPVKLRHDYSNEQYAFLLAHDTDPVNRWEAGQQLAARIILGLVEDFRQGRPMQVDPDFIEACRRTLRDDRLDRALVAETLSMPGETYLAQMMDVIDVDGIHAARDRVLQALSEALAEDFLEVYRGNSPQGQYAYNPEEAGRRSLKNLCLAYLCELNSEKMRTLCMQQFADADNMTDSIGALRVLSNTDCPERKTALAWFYERWQDDPLVLDKWFAIQAVSRLPGTLDEVRHLTAHPAFDVRNPNKVRAVIGAFCSGNPVNFHAADGAGYHFLAEYVLQLDTLNPQIAARLLGALSRWRKYDGARQVLMKSELERIVGQEGLSRDSYEIAIKSLGES